MKIFQRKTAYARNEKAGGEGWKSGAGMEDGEDKTRLIRSLAIYMRQQYLIWNKDSVADETIFSDIEKLSDHRIKVPEGIVLSKIALDANFSRPGVSVKPQGNKNGKRRFQKKNFIKQGNKQ